KLRLGLAAAVPAFSLGPCGGDGDDATDDGGRSAERDAQEMPEAGLHNSADVAAEESGEEIPGPTRSQSSEGQYPRRAMQAQNPGEEPNQDELEQEALDMRINSELRVTEAEDEAYTASEDDVDEYISDMAEENGMDSSDDLMKQFEEQGLDEDQVREDIHKEVLMDQVVETIDSDEPTDDELHEMYDTQVEQLEAMNEQAEDGEEQEVPSFEELKPDLEEQATQQKENEAVEKHLDELREDADIETNI